MFFRAFAYHHVLFGTDPYPAKRLSIAGSRFARSHGIGKISCLANFSVGFIITHGLSNYPQRIHRYSLIGQRNRTTRLFITLNLFSSASKLVMGFSSPEWNNRKSPARIIVQLAIKIEQCTILIFWRFTINSRSAHQYSATHYGRTPFTVNITA